MFPMGLSATLLYQIARASMLLSLTATTLMSTMLALVLLVTVQTPMDSTSVCQRISTLPHRILEPVMIASPSDQAAETFLFLMLNAVQAMESGNNSAPYTIICLSVFA